MRTCWGAILAFGLTSLVDAQQVVHLPIHKKAVSHGLNKRATFPADMHNELGFGQFFVNVYIGTPPQEVALAIGTGSSDIWTLSKQSCSNASLACTGGFFDAGASNTLQYVNGSDGDEFFITYGSGQQIRGTYVTDNFAIGSAQAFGQTFATSTDVTGFSYGLMGIGLASNEVTAFAGNGTTPTFPELLVSQGAISSMAFSIYLDDYSAATGNIIFGGYDTAKFSGELVMLPASGPYMEIPWTSFALTTASSGTFAATGGFAYPISIDVATDYNYLPTDLYQDIVSRLNLTAGSPFKCPTASNAYDDAQLIFEFGGPDGVHIALDIQQLSVPLYNSATGLASTYADGTPACALAIADAGTGQLLLGQSFLRAAYVLFDQDNMLVGLAPAILESTGSNILEYGGSPAAPRVSIDGESTFMYGSTASGVAPTLFATSSVFLATAQTYANNFPTSVRTAIPQSYPTGTPSASPSSPGTATATPTGSGNVVGQSPSGSQTGSASAKNDGDRLHGGLWRGTGDSVICALLSSLSALTMFALVVL